VPEEVLPYTPLGELTVEGMEPEQVWQQLELRTEGIGKVVKEVGAGEGNDEDEDEEGEGSSDEEDEDGWEDGSDEEMTIEEFKRMMAEQGIDDGDEEGSGGDSEDEDEEGFRLRDQMSDGDEDEEEEDDEVDDEEEGEDEDEDEDEEEVSDGDEEDDGDEGDEYDQLEMDGLDVDMGSDEDDIDEATGFAEDDQEVEDDLPGPSRRHRHPTLDDEFFSIDDFNRMTEEAEAGRLSSGRLGGEDDDDDGDIADIGSMMLSGRDEEEGTSTTGDLLVISCDGQMLIR
jgi:U3 small nucleolar RNA-associated protein MPP10